MKVPDTIEYQSAPQKRRRRNVWGILFAVFGLTWLTVLIIMTYFGRVFTNGISVPLDLDGLGKLIVGGSGILAAICYVLWRITENRLPR